MISLEEVREEVKDEEITEEQLDRAVRRAKSLLISYTNNEKLFEKEDTLLEEVVFYLVCMKFNEDVRGRQGLLGESISSVSFTFITDLPDYLKMALNRYRRANFR